MPDNSLNDGVYHDSAQPQEYSSESDSSEGSNKFNASGRYGKPTRKPRAFRIALLILLFLLILCAAAIYFLPYFLPVDTIRSLASEKTRSATGMDLDFHSLEFSWSGGLVVEGISLSPPAAADSSEKPQPLATVDKVLVDVAWSPLFSGRIVVKQVEVNGFSVRVTRDAEGKLSIPDIPVSNLPAVDFPVAAPTAQAKPAGSGNAAMAFIPAIEIRHVELNRGSFSFVDETFPFEAEAGLEFLRIDGSTLDQPFQIAGRMAPYPSTVERGAIDFTGSIRFVKDLAFDPEGEAALDLVITDLPLAEYAAKFALGPFLPAGRFEGTVKLAYQNGVGRAEMEAMALTGVEIGLGDGQNLRLPDTVMAMTAAFDPNVDRIDIGGLSVSNSIQKISGSGWIAGIMEAAEGNIPFGEFDFSGVADLGATAGLLEKLLPSEVDLPAATGEVGFTGKLGMPRTGNGDPLSPALAVDFTSGKVSATDVVPGVSVDVALGGVGVQGVVTLSDSLDIAA